MGTGQVVAQHDNGGDRSIGSVRLRKASATPPLVHGSICPAPAWSELRGAYGRWDSKGLGMQHR